MPPPKVFITGGSGFVGSAVIDTLLTAGWSVHALVAGKPLNRPADRVTSFPGGLFDDAALDAGVAGCDAVIHLVGIIAEGPGGATFQRIHVQGTQRVVAAAARANVRRFIQMSALGARPDAPADYHRTKFEAEEAVRSSALQWTIFRPSMIHGPGGAFMKQMAAWARHRALPYVGMPYFARGLFGLAGSALLQPVFVEDVARAFVESLDNPQTIGEVFPIGGPDRMTWPQMYRQVAVVVTARRRLTLPVPAWYARALTRVIPSALLPFNRSQVLMAVEDNVCDMTRTESAFGWTPRPFSTTLRQYAGSL
jgi:nucleoside-diphosphate-sugar epimerase